MEIKYDKYGENTSGNVSPLRESMMSAESGEVCNMIQGMVALLIKSKKKQKKNECSSKLEAQLKGQLLPT